MSTKMSKLSFRAKPLDASKPMPVYINEDLPGLPDYSAINRAVPQMPSGMYEEEECEHHLQRAICTGLIIPTPEFTDLSDGLAYERLYPPNFKTPRQLVHMQSFAMDQDIPDYDMDSEDEMWFRSQKSKLEITPLKFEEMMDRLEKGSVQTVLSEQQAKALLKDDDDIILAVYEYWLNKRLKTQHPLIPSVRTEHHPATAPNNPYIAFRRRTEKMQTRKHRKNDETSYEKMLKLKRDLSRAVTLLEMIKRREKTKREVLHLTVEVFEKRFQAADYSGQLLAEVSAAKPCSRPAFAPLFPNQFSVNHQNWPPKDEPLPRKEKRQYKKRKHKACVAGVSGVGMGATSSAAAAVGLSAAVGAESIQMDTLSSDEGDASSGLLSGTAVSDDDDSGADASEGPFAFRRRKNCSYHAPLPQGQGNWPWCSREEGGLAERRYRYCLTSLATPPPGRCVGFARRRLGRGGRVILDRAHTPMDDVFRSLDFTIFDSKDKPKVQQKSPLKQWKQPQPRKRRLEQSYPEEQQNSVFNIRPKLDLLTQDAKDVFNEQNTHQSPLRNQSFWHQTLEEDRQKHKSGVQTNWYQYREDRKSRGQECADQEHSRSETNLGLALDEQKPVQELWEDRENEDDALLSEIRNEWLHFRPESQNVMDLSAVRFDVEAPSGGSPTEMSVLDVLCNMQGNFTDTNEVETSNRWGADISDSVREDATTQTMRHSTSPHQAYLDHGASFSSQRPYEPLVSQDLYVGCSQFNVYPGSGARKPSPPQMWATVSASSHLAPGPGRPSGSTSGTRSSYQHRKQERHHVLNQSYSVYNTSGSHSSSSGHQPLSNGVSIIPVSVSAVLSANAGLLRQGLSNGPAGPHRAGPHRAGPHRAGQASIAAVGSSAGRRRAIPVFIKQELLEEQVDASNETYNCLSSGGGAGPSPGAGEGSAPVLHAHGLHASSIDAASLHAAGLHAAGLHAAGLRAAGLHAAGLHTAGLHASAGSADPGTTATAACGEQQKLKSSAASQQHVLMEVT